MEQNLPESYKWFALAAIQGDQDAAKKRDDVGAKLDAASLASARAAIQSFTAQPQPDEAIAMLWIGLLTGFDVVFVTLALWTFEPLMTE